MRRRNDASTGTLAPRTPLVGPRILGWAIVLMLASELISPATAAAASVVATITGFSSPVSVAVNPVAIGGVTYAYVANDARSGSLSVIDTATNAVTTSVSVGKYAYGVAVNPVTIGGVTYAYVTNEGAASVSVVDTNTNAVTSTVSVGTDPWSVAVNPSGTDAYVTNATSASVSVINTSTLAVSSVTVGTDPYDVAVNPVSIGGVIYAYVTNYSSGTVSVIDTATNTVSTTISGFSSPYGIAVNPAGTDVYVVNAGSGSVSVVSTSTNAVTGTVTVGSGPEGIAVDPTGTYAYVDNTTSGTVSQIALSSNTVAATITVGSSPVRVAVSPSGADAYVTNVGSGSVSVIGLSLPSTTTLTTPANPAEVVTFTAVVSGGSSSSTTPTGSVTFNNTSSSTVLCSAVPIAEGTLPVYEAEATCSVTLPTTGGPFSIDAVYGGDSSYSGSTSNSINQATNACDGGALTLTAPSTLTIPSPTLSGLNETVSSSVALDSSDMTGTGLGWNIQATSTIFSGSKGAPLSTSATSFTGASVSGSSGYCVLPTSSVAYSVLLPAGSTAPTGAVIYNAGNSTGEGPFVITMAFSTAIPADAYAQSYSSTWTFTIVSGP